MDIFNAASLNVIREEVHTQAGENIKRHQKKQQRDYESRNKSSASNDIYIGTDVLLRNNLLPNLLPSGCCFRYHQKRFGHIEEQNDKELNIKYKQAQLNLFFFGTRMVLTIIKISQRTKFIKVVMIVSKILLTTLFRITNLWTKSKWKTARTTRFPMKQQL